MTPAQLRAARGLLNWSRRDLADRSGTSPEAVQWFEARGGDPKLSTTQKWRRALQAAGVEFVEPDERTATAALTSVVRSSAQAAGPLLAAVLVPLGLSAPLVLCAVMKIGYDVALYVGFRGRPAPEEVRPTV